MNKKVMWCLSSAICLVGMFSIGTNKAGAEEVSTPMIVGQGKVIYLDGKDKIDVYGDGIVSKTYSSTNTRVATITKKGMVKPHTKGTAVISAKVVYRKEAGGKKYNKTLKYKVTVKGNSTEYFVYAKSNHIYRLKLKAKKQTKIYFPSYSAKGKVATINAGVLNNIHKVQKIYLGDNIEEFGRDHEAFVPVAAQNCENLQKIVGGKNLKCFGRFENCRNVSEMEIDPRNKNLCSVDGVLYAYGLKYLECYPPAKEDESYSIPDGVEFIADYAFYQGQYLKNLTMTDSVKYLCNAVFQMSNLETVVLSNNITSLSMDDCEENPRAFYNCTKLTTVYLPDKLMPLNFSEFKGCSSLTTFVASPQNLYYENRDGALYSKGSNYKIFPV